MLKDTKQIIEEIKLRKDTVTFSEDDLEEEGIAVVPFDYLQKVLNSHSERIDTALALLSVFEKSSKSDDYCNMRIGRYSLSFDEGELLYCLNQQVHSTLWYRAFSGSLTDCIQFIQSQEKQ